MSPEAVRSVINRYEEEMSAYGRFPAASRLKKEHVLGMCRKVRQFLDEGRIEKAMRWLGFIQGWFWAIEHYSVKELADHNRTASEQHPGPRVKGHRDGCPWQEWGQPCDCPWEEP